MVEGLAAALKLGREQTDDIKTAVSEACNNVVLHAYGDEGGPMEVDADVSGSHLSLIVRDHGSGIRPHSDWPEGSVHGVGLAVIQTYADRAVFRGRGGEGTEVCMAFALPDGESALFDPCSAVDAGPAAETQLAAADGEVVMAVCGPPLLSAVLTPVVSVLATRAHFTVDRLSDAALVADALAAASATLPARRPFVLAMHARPRELALSMGPFPDGSGGELMRPTYAELPAVVARLSDAVNVQTGADGEHVHLRMTDPR
jgi:serine/threonine-protein kinase RsbW